METEGYAFFSFENTGYRPGARYDEGDVAELAARLARTGPEGLRRRADLETHFAPRGQGFEHAVPGRGGSYFVGRTAELDRIGHWLAHGDPAWGRGLLVTGGPGVGKSALLGKLLLRSGGRTADAPAPTAVHARHRFLEDLVAAVADAAGVPAGTPQALLGALAARRAPLHLIVDALDEAGEAHGDDTEARRIAAELLCPLLRVPCVRLLVGTRPHVLDAFGGEPAVLDLDDSRETSGEDIAHYARRLLQAPDGPGSRGPYDDDAAETVAREIAARARGSFLSARIAARHLGRAPRPVDPTEPGWHARLPEVGETPGVTFLRVLRHQLGPTHPRALPLLTALALAEGPGLPPDQVWRTIATACTTSTTDTGPTATDTGPGAQAVAPAAPGPLAPAAPASAAGPLAPAPAASSPPTPVWAIVPLGRDGWAHGTAPSAAPPPPEPAPAPTCTPTPAPTPATTCTPAPTPAFTWDDIAWLLATVGEHLVEELDADGRSVYRLYHQAYADALRTTLDPGARSRVAHALAALVPEAPHGRDWAAAPPYVRRHLAEHAEGTELLDVLALDAEYLLTAPVSALQRVLNRAGTERGRAAARAVGHCAALLHAPIDEGTRAAQLRLSAFQSGAEELAGSVRRRYPRLPWDTEWAEVAPVPYTTLGRFAGGVRGAAVVPVGDRSALVTAERDGPVRVWDTEGGELLAELPTDLGPITAVHGCPTRPWAALRTAERIWVWDVESRDLIGAVAAPRDTVDCAVTDLGGECLVTALDPDGRVVLATASGESRPLTLVATSRRALPWSSFDGDRLAVEHHEGRLRVAVTRVHWWKDRLRRARLTVWDLGGGTAGALTVERKAHRVLRGRDVEAFALHRGTVLVATHLTLSGPLVGTWSTVRSDGIRVVEWSGHPHGSALLLTPGAGPEAEAEPICLSATAYAVTARSPDGRVVGRTRTDAPVRRLLAAGHGPDGLRLVSLGADAWSAKGWHLGPPPEDGDTGDDPETTVLAGRISGLPVVVVRDPDGVRLLDGGSGAVLDHVEGTTAGGEAAAGAEAAGATVVEAHPGGPVLRWKRPRKPRHPVRVSTWDGGSSSDFPEVRGLTAVLPVPGDGAPRFVACIGHYKKSERCLGLYGADGRKGELLHLDLHDVRAVRLVPDGARVFAAAVGYQHFDGVAEEGPPPRPHLTVRSLPDDTVRFRLRVSSVDIVHDLGRWPEGPVLGYVDSDGEIAVRTRFPASFRADPLPPDIVPRPDRVRVTAFRLQTRNGRPTVLAAGADGALTLFAADTTEVLHRVHLGGEILGLDWIDDERLSVHTATGVLCLRLG
ncbi:NACHT and WD repeat domain-containing protein [Streptomyces sp. NPDC093089]|uniref:NACHT and WD repeat domain-containing protein n=1 Tax=Streptomyces sp. NPDC093089 TaxID=3366024 RepID=UPI0037F7F570